MAVFWLQPLAWWGLALLAAPILIHLLVRQHSRRLMFPSLRFLRATRLAAVRRHAISDWPLLIVRMLILAAAVAAVAAPVFVSAARKASWDLRIARAIVIAPAPGSAVAAVSVGGASAGARSTAASTTVVEPADAVTRVAEDERRSAFVSAVFTPASSIADGVRDAALWLRRQPPASREIVVIGDLRAASIVGDDLDFLPPSTGVRILPMPAAEPVRRVILPAIAEARPGAGAEPFAFDVALPDTETTATRVNPLADSFPLITVRAAAADQAPVNAALRAVLSEGLLPGRHRERRTIIAFDGAPAAPLPLTRPASEGWMRRVLEQLPSLSGGEEGGALLVQVGIPGNDLRAVDAIARIARLVYADDASDLEPRAISAATVAALSRTPGPSPEEVVPADEGDRRLLWGAALVLLTVEWLLRRRRRHEVSDSPAAQADAEVRVA